MTAEAFTETSLNDNRGKSSIERSLDFRSSDAMSFYEIR
jgi:hypothetical protein